MSEIVTEPGRPVVIDLSEIREWDSDGAAALVALAETSDRVRITGFAEATQRMLGVGELDLASPPEPGSDAPAVVRLRATAVYRPRTADELSGRLEAIIADLEADATTFVLDLAGLPELDAAAIEATAFGSSLAAVRGVRVMVVNVPGDELEALRRAGLSAQTWVAPPPLA